MLMAECQGCGRELGEGSRFCSQCGAPVGTPEVAAATAGAEVEMLGTTTTVASATVSHGRGRSLWVVAALILAVVGFVLWSSSSSSPSEADAEGAAEERAGVEDESERPPTTSRPRPSTSEQARDEPPATTTVEAAIGSGEPVLGQPVGLSLLYGGRRLQRLDLDTGEITSYDTGGVPLLASGGRLVLSDSDGRRVRSVPVDQPAAQGVELADGISWWYTPGAGAGPEPGQAWMLTGGPETTWNLIALESGATLDVVPAALSIGWSGGPSVVTTPAGGVFALEGGGRYTKVFDGALVAASDEYAVAQTCAGPLDCELHWLLRSSWDEVDRPAPAADPLLGGWLSPGGRVLGVHAVRGDTIETVVFDVERELVIDVAADGGFLIGGTPAFSPGGRYVAMAPGQGIVVYDSDTGELHEIPAEAFSTEGYPNVVFVENS
jgi:hypothetical protein